MPTDLEQTILQLKKESSIYAPFADGEIFAQIIDALAQPFKHTRVDKVLGLEARGFILGAPVAYVLQTGFVVARKKGKMYPKYDNDYVYSTSAIDYSGTEKTLEIEKNTSAIQREDKVLIVDDWFETGGQGHAAIRLVEMAGGEVVGICMMLDNMKEETRDSFSKYKLHSIAHKPNTK